MNQNSELTKTDLVVDRDIQIDDDNNQVINVFFECWFDAEQKFGIDLSDENTWLNMYGQYNPYEDTLEITCAIDREDGNLYFDYIPTDGETRIMKDMITAKIQELFQQSPQEFCEYDSDEAIEMGGIH